MKFFVSITVTFSKETGALCHSMKFFSHDVALYFYKYVKQLYFVCYCGAPFCYLNMLDKLRKHVYRTVDPLLAASLEPLAHCRSEATISLFCRYYYVRYSSELAELVPLPYSCGRSIRYSNRLDNFLSLFLDVVRMSLSTVSFLPRLDSGILYLQNAFLRSMI